MKTIFGKIYFWLILFYLLISGNYIKAQWSSLGGTFDPYQLQSINFNTGYNNVGICIDDSSNVYVIDSSIYVTKWNGSNWTRLQGYVAGGGINGVLGMGIINKIVYDSINARIYMQDMAGYVYYHNGATWDALGDVSFF